jgi:hypothetical protein
VLPPRRAVSLSQPFSVTLHLLFCRTQDTYAFGIAAGFAASAFSIFLLWRSFRCGNGVEAWHYTAQFLWLFANAWWMYGELTDWRFPQQPKIEPQHRLQAGYMMLFAWVWLFLYYAVLQHMSLFAPLFTSSPHAVAMSVAPNRPCLAFDVLRRFNEEHLQPRVWMKSFFPTWRSYENVHIFFWLAKDTSWNQNWHVTWIVFSIPTVLIALDFAWQTAHVKVCLSLLWLPVSPSYSAFRAAWSTTCTTSCKRCGSLPTLCGPTASFSFRMFLIIPCRSFLSRRKRSIPCAGSVLGHWRSRSCSAWRCMRFGSSRARSSRPPTHQFTRPVDQLFQTILTFFNKRNASRNMCTKTNVSIFCTCSAPPCGE